MEIYPENINKYKGVIKTLPNGKYMTEIKNNNKSECKTHNTREEAEDYKMQRCTELGLVKNIVYDRGDYYEVSLTQGQLAKFDKEDFYKIDQYIWAVHKGVTGGYYALTNLKETHESLKMHQHILNYKPIKDRYVDHINRDTLDNRKNNLRIVSQAIQSINRDLRSDNTSGETGVYYDKNRKRWSAQWMENGEKKYKAFSVSQYGEEAKQKAIDYRNEMIAQQPEYKFALNI